jgi:hypothetical protein
MNPLSQIYGTVFLFHAAQPYHNHLLCPVQNEGETGYRAMILLPDGQPIAATSDDRPYPTVKEAIDAARVATDIECAYWGESRQLINE